MSRRTKSTYLLLLLALVVQPHVIRGHILGLTEPVAESLGTIMLLLLGYVVYRLHKKEVVEQQQEVVRLTDKLDVSSSRLIESYEYIGLVNRKLPVMEHLTSELLERTPSSKKEKAQIFSDLLTTAASLANVDWGMFRVVDTSTGSTDKEFIGSGRHYTMLKTQISNKRLLSCNGGGRKICAIDDMLALRSSDTKNEKQMFLILPKTKDKLSENVPLLQNITDQAQLFYKYLYDK